MKASRWIVKFKIAVSFMQVADCLETADLETHESVVFAARVSILAVLIMHTFGVYCHRLQQRLPLSTKSTFQPSLCSSPAGLTG